jgi:ATP-dependent helicase/nuclease subunit A
VLTGETADHADALEMRARTLLAQLGIAEAARPEDGPWARELAATTLRGLAIPEIVACRSRLLPEMTVFSAQAAEDRTTYVGGIADAIAYAASGAIDLVIDWKTDVSPSTLQIDLYRQQIRDYLIATGASDGLLVFVTTGQLIHVRPNLLSITAATAQLSLVTPASRQPDDDKPRQLELLL